MTGRPIQFSFQIAKVDAEKRQVWGYATIEQPDKQGDIVDYNASIEAFRKWPGNIRQQHDKTKAVGVCVGWEPVPDKRAIWVGAQLSRSRDGEDCFLKVQEGVLRGFSIGGEALQSRPEVGKAGGRTYNRITEYRLDELSLVDNPACPGATIQLVKTAGGGMSTPTEVIEKMAPLSPKKLAKWASPHPLELVTGSGMSGNSYRLIGKSADGQWALYVDNNSRNRTAFVGRHRSGARQISTDLNAVRKFAVWMELPGETILSDLDIAGALTTRDDPTRTGSGIYRSPQHHTRQPIE
jgi:phage head maturation protease